MKVKFLTTGGKGGDGQEAREVVLPATCGRLEQPTSVG